MKIRNLSGEVILVINEANLQGVDLQGANLQGANLQGVDLQGANLQRANLQRANLYKANLQGATNGNFTFQIPITQIGTSEYPIILMDQGMQIGCELHTYGNWFSFTKKEILNMDGKTAFAFWKQWCPILKEICKSTGRV